MSEPDYSRSHGRSPPRARARRKPDHRFCSSWETGKWWAYVRQCAGDGTTCRRSPEAYLMLHTGSSQFIRPSLGAWTLYGLGTESDDLPGFITIKPTGRNGGAQNYGSAFLPAAYQGTRIGNEGQPIADARVGNIKNPRLDPAAQRLQLDLVQAMNRDLLERERVNPGVEGVIESYELAFRMQGELPGVMDLAGESAATQAALRHRRPGDRRLRPPVPAGPALRRGGRPVRRAHARRLGPAPQPEGRPRPATPGPSTSRSPACSRTCTAAACSTTRW